MWGSKLSLPHLLGGQRQGAQPPELAPLSCVVSAQRVNVVTAAVIFNTAAIIFITADLTPRAQFQNPMCACVSALVPSTLFVALVCSCIFFLDFFPPRISDRLGF